MELLRKYPEALPIVLIAHLVLVALLIFGFDFRARDASPPGAAEESPVQAYTVDPEALDRAVAALEAQERREAEERRQAEAERERLQQEQREERERLEQLRQEREETEAAARRAADAVERQRREAETEAARAEQLRREAEAEAERVEQQRREAEAEAERAEQQRREAEEAERRRQEEEERRRQEEEERRRAEEARRQAEAEAQARREAEEAAQAAAEREARERELDSMLARYRAAIRGHVSQNWRMPSGFESGWECEVRVTQIPSGDVTDVRIGRCDGGSAFRDSVEAAVRRASPLPQAPDPEVFSREIQFTFRPES